MSTQSEVLGIISDKAIAKTSMTLPKQITLGMLAGLYVSMGYIVYIRAAAMTNSVVGACMFPIALILVMLAGAELATGNMLVMAVGCCRKRINVLQLMKNWAIILLSNLAGSLMAAFFLGQYAGLTNSGDFLAVTLATAASKTGDSFGVAFVSGILCNVFVCMAVWLSFSAQDFVGKVLAIWFPIMVFVVSGSQHVVANMFVIPAALFSGEAAAFGITWAGFALNLLAVGLGNAVGGALIVGAIYAWIYKE